MGVEFSLMTVVAVLTIPMSSLQLLTWSDSDYGFWAVVFLLIEGVWCVRGLLLAEGLVLAWC